MDGAEAKCPACAVALKATAVSGVPVRLCPQCHGSLLAQLDMIRTLEAMSTELLKTIDPDANLERVAKRAGTVACPACARTMAPDDYCSAGVAHFDRCQPCALLWVGAEELGTMAMMWARMERRLERVQRITQEALDDADTFVRAARMKRVASRILGRFL
jgi:Zn-finger nucleic acid-binding protein